MNTYLCLYHEHSVSSQFQHQIKYVYLFIVAMFIYKLHEMVHSNVCTCTSHTSTVTQHIHVTRVVDIKHVVNSSVVDIKHAVNLSVVDIKHALNLSVVDIKHAVNSSVVYIKHAVNSSVVDIKHALNLSVVDIKHALNLSVVDIKHAVNLSVVDIKHALNYCYLKNIKYLKHKMYDLFLYNAIFETVFKYMPAKYKLFLDNQTSAK